MKVVIYARYSCEKQTEQSIEGQVRECREFADKHDMTIVDTYIDRAISGTSTAHRDAFLKMIADAECHLFDGILVYKIDRFARNRYDSAIYTRLYCKIYDFAIPAMNCRWWLCHQEPPFILPLQSLWLCSRFWRHCKQRCCLQ